MNKALGWHVTSYLVLDRLIAPSSETRRLTARKLLELPARHGLLAFAIPDNHLHLLLACDRRTAGRGTNKAEGSLVKRLQLPVGFEPARNRPVETLSHLTNAFHYLLGQTAHHGTSGDPVGECSNLWDLLGTRLTGTACLPRVRVALPRLQRSGLMGHLPVDALTAGSTASLLPQAAAAAIARPDLGGQQADSRAARAAVFQVAQHLGLTQVAARDLLDVPGRTASRLSQAHVPQPLLTAIRLQLGLREAPGTTRLAA